MSCAADHVTPLDIRTEAGWKAIIESEQRHISEIASDEELRSIIVSIFCREDPRGLEDWSTICRVCLVGFLEGDSDEQVERAKDAFALHTRIVGLAGDAIATITVMEAWLSVRTEEDAPHVQPRNDPHRQEGICLIAQHREFRPTMWVSMIQRDAGDKRVLQPWTLQTTGVAGRMSFEATPDLMARKKELQELARVVLSIQGMD